MLNYLLEDEQVLKLKFLIAFQNKTWSKYTSRSKESSSWSKILNEGTGNKKNVQWNHKSKY